MSYYNHSFSVDATVMVSKKCPIISEHVAIILVTLNISVATVSTANNWSGFNVIAKIARLPKKKISLYLEVGESKAG